MLDIITTYHQSLLNGIGITLLLLVLSVLVGLLLSILFAALKYFNVLILRQLIDVFIFIIRGTPFLVQLFIIYYGPSQLAGFSASTLGILFKSAFFCALLALVLNTTAYTTSLFYGAIKNLPATDIDSAHAMAFGKIQCFLYIIMPRFFIRVLPAYNNEVIMVLKCTSLVSTISLLDLMGEIKQTIAITYQTMTTLAIGGLVYLLLTIVISYGLRLIYNRYSNID